MNRIDAGEPHPQESSVYSGVEVSEARGIVVGDDEAAGQKKEVNAHKPGCGKIRQPRLLRK